jgi:hypothetical protein
MKKLIDKFGNFQFDILELPSRGIFYNIDRSFVYVKYLTAKEENILSTPSLSETDQALDIVIESVLLDDIKVEELLSVDRKAIILFLRSTSFGDSFELEVTCSNCSTKTNQGFRFSMLEMSDVEIDKNTVFSVKLKIKEGEDFYEIRFKPLTYGQEKEIKSRGENRIITNTVVSQIYEIEHNYKVKDVDSEFFMKVIYNQKEQIQKFISSLPLKKFQELKKKMEKKLPAIIEELSCDCPNCGQVNTFSFQVNDSLLKLEARYRTNFEEEVFLIQYYGKGGFDKESLYNTSILSRRKTLERINNEIEKKNKAEQDAVNKSKSKR